MSHELSGESAEDLIQVARERGHRVSKTQLSRWHRAGLLPHPIRHGLGRARGVTWLYPSGTKSRLLAICEARKRERRLHFVAWTLWWAGDNDLTGHIRNLLLRICENERRLTRRFIREGALTSRGLKDAEHYFQEGRIKDKLTRRVRKRVGRLNMPTLMRVMGTIASGNFQQWADPDDSRILRKALILPKDPTSVDILSQEVGQVMKGLPDTVRNASEGDLFRARHAARVLLTITEAQAKFTAYSLDAALPMFQVILVLVMLAKLPRVRDS